MDARIGKATEVDSRPANNLLRRLSQADYALLAAHVTVEDSAASELLYNPDKAQFGEFDPFWEFVAGPLHAGTFGPNDLDNTFGPEVKFIKAPGPGNQNLPPSAGMQFFGHVRIDGASGQMTVTLRDRADVALWSTTLDPKPV